MHEGQPGDIRLLPYNVHRMDVRSSYSEMMRASCSVKRGRSGRGPISLISPRKTSAYCGNSSIPLAGKQANDQSRGRHRRRLMLRQNFLPGRSIHEPAYRRAVG